MKRSVRSRAKKPALSVVCTLVIGAALGATTFDASADFISVPQDFETIQAAMQAAEDGDTILVASGTYEGPVRFNGKKITVRSLSGPLFTEIISPISCIQFIDGETLDSKIEGFTIIGGNTTFGGGVHISDSSGTVSGCIVQGSAAVRGGAISVQWGSANIISTDFSGSAGVGGGLSLYHASATLTNSSGSGNASQGGGVAVIDSSLTCNSSGFGGSAASEGGGMFVLRSSIELRNVAVSGSAGNPETISARGGGLCILDSPVPFIESCSFSASTVEAISQAEGGGIYSDNSLELMNVTFFSNTLVSGGVLPDKTVTDGSVAGAGFYSASGPCTVVDCYFARNEAENEALAETPDGIALGGSAKVSDDTLFQKCIFYDLQTFTHGGYAFASLDARGGCIEAGSGDVTMIGCTILDARAIGAEAPDEDELPIEGEGSGGGIWTAGELSFKNSVIFNAQARGYPYSAGGGVVALEGAELENSVISENFNIRRSMFPPNPAERPLGGGGIYAGTSVVTVVDSTINSNSSLDEGGGIFARIVNISGSTVSGNGSGSDGGGVYCQIIDVDDTRMEVNGGDYGGAICAMESATVREAIIVNNQAGRFGGGVYSTGPLLIENTEGLGNSVLSIAPLQPAGGGFAWSDEALTLRDCYSDGNQCNSAASSFGGAVGSSGVATIHDSIFRKNLSNGLIGSGGAISTQSGSVENCTFYLNQVIAGTASGGSIALENGGGIFIHNCDFQRDMVSGEQARGGSVFCAGGNVQISSSTFLECSSSLDGGAVSISGESNSGDLVLMGSTFQDNVAEGSGGALSVTEIRTIDIRDSTFLNNMATDDGGGADLRVQPNFSSSFVLDQCVFELNSSSQGGGLALLAGPNGTADVKDSVFSNNSAFSGGGIRVVDAIELRCQNDAFCANTPDSISGEWSDLGGNSLFGEGDDCNGNGSCDALDIGMGSSSDCNANGVPDECDIADGTSQDADNDGEPDECVDDCNANGISDQTEIETGAAQDCNVNAVPDECDIANGTSLDVDDNGVPDECDPDCNGNGLPDSLDLATGTSEDCNDNLQPDECDIAGGGYPDQDQNGVPDECECLGELDGDDQVDGADITVLLGEWGPAEPGEPADINGDGAVNGGDLIILLANYGECFPSELP